MLDIVLDRVNSNTAVETGTHRLSYADLRGATTALARRLQNLGVARGDVVGVSLDRNLLLPVSMLAIMRSGAVYLPLDAHHPRERLDFMMRDSSVRVIITDQDCEPPDAVQVLRLDPEAVDRGRPGDVFEIAPPRPDEAAYIMYTSGSTGRPKGVLVEHRALSHVLGDFSRRIALGKGDGLLATTSINFDISLLELLLPLLCGARLVLMPRNAALSPQALMEKLREGGISVLQLTPSVLSRLVMEGWVPPGGFDVLCGGDRFPDNVATSLLSRGARVWNLYGPTEATIWCTCQAVAPSLAPQPIGLPIDGMTVAVVDEHLEPVPDGAVGEALIGGIGVARGYVGRPGLTAERFLPDPASTRPGARRYRTGDLVRRRPDGALEFLGRLDDQVKIRGFRVEPGEVEAALGALPAVAAAAVVPQPGPAGERRLVAFLVSHPGAPRVPVEQLRRQLARTLPDYMVPAAFVWLDRFPLTLNGKLDRRALPEPPPERPDLAVAFVPPRSEDETLLASLWADLLGLTRVGVHDDFFALGGHSLLATRLASRVRAGFGVELPIRAVFDNPTVETLALAVRDARGSPARPSITRRAASGPTLLSFAQERLWFLDRLGGLGPAYNVPVAVRLRGSLDLAALDQAIAAVADRHAVLRTNFVERDGVPYAVEAPPGTVRLDVVALSPVTPTALDDALARHREAPFDLAAGPLLRARALVVGPQDHVLSIVAHHIAVDGWSLSVLAGEVGEAYRHLTRGEALPPRSDTLDYADYAAWQRDWLAQGAADRQLLWWKDALRGLAELDLPTDHPRPARPGAQGGQVDASLTGTTLRGLERLARAQDATLFMVLLAAFKVVLARYARQTDIAVGAPIANRTSAEVEAMVGFFVNTLVLRTDLSGNPDVAELIGRVRRTTLDAYANQDLPFERLVAELAPRRDAERHPLFQVMFVFQNMPDAVLSLPGVAAEPLAHVLAGAKFDLSLVVVPQPNGLDLRLEYDGALFERGTAAALLASVCTLTQSLPEGGARGVMRLPLVEAERLTPVRPAPPPAGDVASLFRAAARAHPDRVAVEDGARALTYAELDGTTERWALALRARGLKQGSVVAVILPRSLDLIACLIAIIKAGHAYLVLDLRDPIERRRYMLADAGARLIVSNDAATVLADFGDNVPAMALHCLDRGPGELASNPLPFRAIVPEDLAYVVYTSGTSGTSKGVMSHHGGVVNVLRQLVRQCFVGPSDRVLQVPRPTFDGSVRDIFGTLTAGATLIVLDDARAQSPTEVADVIDKGRITRILSATPSFVDALAAELLGRSDLVLNTVLVAGESLRVATIAALKASIGRDLVVVNQYGATECTMASTRHLCVDASGPKVHMPIGLPIDGMTVAVVDEHLEPVPDGAVGEALIGGIGVARGYVGRPGLTAERFLPDPASTRPGARRYRTGDLVRRRPDGALEFLGRLDDQVKIRGFRVEPGEVEAALGALPAVAAAAVVPQPGPAGERRLVAFLVSHPGAPRVPVEQLRRQLARTLPDYMVPAAFVWLDRFPLTLNGKLDRRALPEPPPERPDLAVAFVPPRSEDETLLASLWADLLGLTRVGVHDDFFALGGHSLLATRLASRVRAGFGVELPIRAVFDNPTVETLALAVRDARGSPARPSITRRAASGPTLLSFAQERLWFLDRLGGLGPAYNVPVAVRLRGSLDLAALDQAIAAVADRHAVLRTNFVERDGVPYAVEAPPGTVRLDVVALSPVTPTALDDALARHREAPFDLAAGPLLRARALVVGPQDHVLSIVAHHIAVDGWSLSVLAGEVGEAYRHLTRGEALPPRSDTLDYADYAAWQRDWLAQGAADRQLLWWKDALRGLAELDLPTDHPRPARPGAQGGQVDASLTGTTLRGLERLARAQDATLFMVLLAAFKVVLARYARQTDIAVGAPIANRTSAEVEAMVGFFVNTLVLRTDLSGNPDVAELIGRVRRTTLDAYANQDLPFERLVAELAPRRDAERHPLFQVMFVFQNMPDAVLSLPGVAAEPLAHVLAGAKFDLSLVVVPQPNGLDLRLEYDGALFERGTAAALLASVCTLTQSLPEGGARGVMRLPLVEAERLTPVRPAPPPAGDVASLFRAAARAHPDRVAVEDGARALTYAELDGTTERWALALRARGLKQGSVVGISMSRTIDRIAVLLALLKTGSAYLPIDPRHPDALVRPMLTRSRVVAVVVDRESMRPFPDVPAWDVEGLDYQERLPDVELPSNHGQTAAAIMHTSGSTGEQKGIVTTHANIISLANDETLQTLLQDRTIVSTAPLAFDASNFEVLACLLNGGRIALPGSEELISVDQLYDAIGRHSPSTLWLTTGLFNEVAARDLASLERVKTILTGGDRADADSIARVIASGRITVINCYGPTETTTFASCAVISTPEQLRHPISIGHPVAAAHIAVVDEHLEPVPDGAVGEALIGGIGVARGYVGRPGLTAERFLPDPASTRPGARRYRTGDLVRRRPDGALEFLGRLDDQVKIRGFRVEPGEVEAALGALPAVAAAAVVPQPGPAGERRLVAFLVSHPGAPRVPVEQLRRQLARTLPDYMVPAAFVWLDRFPLTLNGKLDRRALPEPPPERPDLAVAFVPPRSEDETLLASLWADLLGLTRVGVHDDFFALGGHSLLATRLASRVRAGFGVELPIRAVFDNPTVETLALAVRRSAAEPLPRTTPYYPATVDLTPLRAAAPTVFCVHAIGGSPYSYVALARQLGGVNVVAFQAPGWNSNHAPLTDISDLARLYKAHIEGRQTGRRHCIVGWSFGGLVALEIGRALFEKGDDVYVVLIDTVLPAQESGLPPSDVRDGYENHLRKMHHSLSMKSGNRHEIVLEGDEGGENFKVFGANMDAMRKHVVRAYEGGTTLFIPKIGASHMSVERWRSICPRICVIEVEGDHYTALQRPAVSTIADHIDRLMKREPVE